MVVQPTQRHYDAFNYFFNLTQKGYGTTEALKLTAEHVGIGIRRMWIWYDDLDWKNKRLKRLEDIQKEYEKRENRELAKNQKRYLDILHKLLYNYVEDGLPAGIESVRDLETVIKTSLLLQNAPTEVTSTESKSEVKVESDSLDGLFDKDLMRKILDEEDMS